MLASSSSSSSSSSSLLSLLLPTGLLSINFFSIPLTLLLHSESDEESLSGSVLVTGLVPPSVLVMVPVMGWGSVPSRSRR